MNGRTSARAETRPSQLEKLLSTAAPRTGGSATALQLPEAAIRLVASCQGTTSKSSGPSESIQMA